MDGAGERSSTGEDGGAVVPEFGVVCDPWFWVFPKRAVASAVRCAVCEALRICQYLNGSQGLSVAGTYGGGLQVVQAAEWL